MKENHIILQKIARHGRVNIGNFSETLTERLLELIDQEKIWAGVSGEDTWVYLTHLGTQCLFDLNSRVINQING
jgi:hypothetical protein